MSLTEETIEEHVVGWSRRLADGPYNFRAQWPAFVFRHEPVENAAVILSSGVLLSRNKSVGLRPKDVADPEVVATTDRAHDFARLYFRPRNPTQWNIEGVRKSTDPSSGGQAAHAPVLIMLLFDARRIFSAQNVMYSNGNMQSSSARFGAGDDFFSSIEFEKVYHHGPIGGDRSVITARCAEILVPDALPLLPSLQKILCRSQAERQTLLNFLGPSSETWSKHIQVSLDTTVFERQYTLVESVSLSNDGLLFRLKPRIDNKTIKVEVRIRDAEDDSLFIRGPKEIPATPNGGGSYLLKFDVRASAYIASIYLEDCLAFQSTLYRPQGPL